MGTLLVLRSAAIAGPIGAANFVGAGLRCRLIVGPDHVCSVFNLVLTYGYRYLREAWMNVVHVILWLRHMHLLPDTLQHMDDIRDSDGRLLPSLRDAGAPVGSRKKSLAVSFLSSALQSMWLVDDDDEGDQMWLPVQ